MKLCIDDGSIGKQNVLQMFHTAYNLLQYMATPELEAELTFVVAYHKLFFDNHLKWLDIVEAMDDGFVKDVLLNIFGEAFFQKAVESFNKHFDLWRGDNAQLTSKIEMPKRIKERPFYHLHHSATSCRRTGGDSDKGKCLYDISTKTLAPAGRAVNGACNMVLLDCEEELEPQPARPVRSNRWRQCPLTWEGAFLVSGWLCGKGRLVSGNSINNEAYIFPRVGGGGGGCFGFVS